MNNQISETLIKINQEVGQIYDTYKGKSLESVYRSSKEFTKAKEMYNENMQKTKVGELTLKTEKELEGYKTQYIKESREKLDNYENLRVAELAKTPLTKEDKILDELVKSNLHKEYEFKYGVMDGKQIQEDLSNIDNELEFNVAKYIAYNKLDDKSILNMNKYQDKILQRITEMRGHLRLSEIQVGNYLVDGQVEYLITGDDPSNYYFS